MNILKYNFRIMNQYYTDWFIENGWGDWFEENGWR